jgi:Holliday junction resolvasome RuvABC endonuclease subunit
VEATQVVSAVIGLDLSSTATGVATEGGTWTIKPKGSLHERARIIADSVALTASGADLGRRPLVVMEAIGTRHVQTAIAIATVHALVRHGLHAIDIEPIEISPAVLKKWATGKGNCDKTAMILAATRAGWDAPLDATDDQADAWWLRTIGCAVLGTWDVAQTAPRAAIVADIRSHHHLNQPGETP